MIIEHDGDDSPQDIREMLTDEFEDLAIVDTVSKFVTVTEAPYEEQSVFAGSTVTPDPEPEGLSGSGSVTEETSSQEGGQDSSYENSILGAISGAGALGSTQLERIVLGANPSGDEKKRFGMAVESLTQSKVIASDGPSEGTQFYLA